MSAPCPRCIDCKGQEHHWLEADDRFCSRYECKHCPAQCFAVDDEEDPLGGYKPSGIVIVVTAKMAAARDQMLDLIDRYGNDLENTTAAKWLLEEVGCAVQLRLDAIEDGEIEDDENEGESAS